MAPHGLYAVMLKGSHRKHYVHGALRNLHDLHLGVMTPSGGLGSLDHDLGILDPGVLDPEWGLHYGPPEYLHADLRQADDHRSIT